MSNFNELSKEQQERAIKLLQKADDQKLKDLRYNTRNKLMLQKAHKAGIKVSEEEVEAVLKAQGKI